MEDLCFDPLLFVGCANNISHVVFFWGLSDSWFLGLVGWKKKSGSVYFPLCTLCQRQSVLLTPVKGNSHQPWFLTACSAQATFSSSCVGTSLFAPGQGVGIKHHCMVFFAFFCVTNVAVFVLFFSGTWNERKLFWLEKMHTLEYFIFLENFHLKQNCCCHYRLGIFLQQHVPKCFRNYFFWSTFYTWTAKKFILLKLCVVCIL